LRPNPNALATVPRPKPLSVRFVGAALCAASSWVGSATLLAQAPTAAQSPVAPVAESANILPIGDVRAGQKGFGISVFSGSEPERFEVEIVGVLRKFSAGEDLILARLTGKGLESTGVIAGMSGSPVWIDGKLIGAVALGWPFSKEAIAGVRPIESMLRLAEPVSTASIETARVRPRSRTSAELSLAGSPDERLRALAAGDVPESLIAPILDRLRTSGEAGGAPRVPWAMTGFGAGSRAWFDGLWNGGPAAAAVSPATPAGIAADMAAITNRLRGGDPVAAVLVDGDLRLAATGTVTARDGDRILAFGHPFLGGGPMAVPMAPAEIVTVMPSAYSSFKLSNLGAVAGAFTYDAQAGILGRIGEAPPTIPLEILVGERRYAMRLARLPEYVGLLAATSFYGALDGAGFLQGEQGVSIRFEARLSSGRRLELAQDFDGAGAPLAASRYLLAAIDYVATNPLENVEFETLRLTVDRAGASRQAFLVGARTPRVQVEPGETLRLDLEFKQSRGAIERRSIEVRIPESTPEGRLSLMLGDGATLDGLRFGLEPVGPIRFDQALEFLNGLHARRDLVVLAVRGGRGVSESGEPLADLPGSIRSLWGAAAQGSAPSLRYTVRELAVRSLAEPFAGAARVDLDVKRTVRSRNLSETE
jgi:hypothetical protein